MSAVALHAPRSMTAAAAAALGGLMATVVVAQQPASISDEVHPMFDIQECTGSGGSSCTTQTRSLVMDANWRWIQEGGSNCYTNANTWDPVKCADPAVCAQKCSVEGASIQDYRDTYGVTTTGDSVRLNFVTEGQYSKNYGSRMYLMENDDTYRMFHLKNREFAMTVDGSNLPCGLNSAVYFVEMSATGDKDGDGNKAGAKYGTGYCDAQCPHDIKFIKGQANSLDWDSTADPPVGHFGACCAEMDIWEANSQATAFTPHPCSQEGLTKCEGVTCGDGDQRYEGICDKDGCDWNSYRLGNTSFYGNGFAVDSSRPVTVVTQFLTSDGTDSGALSEIRRFYVQDGHVVPNSEASILGSDAGNSITDSFCTAQKDLFGDTNDFMAKGQLESMGAALDRGMVLVLSLWDDSQVNMLWLDAAFPADQPRSTPGVARGPCPGDHTSTPQWLRDNKADSHVTFSDIKVGTIGSTTAGVTGRRLGTTFI